MAQKEATIKVGLVCSVCQSRNYVTRKNKLNLEGKKIVLRKYCKKCRKHQEHKETEKLD